MAPLSIIPLDKNWLFRQANGSSSAQTFRPTAMFPTNTHLDLLAHDLIPDPFPAKNEEAVQWVEDQRWIYRTSFSIPNDISRKRHKHTTLVFEGLDTFATVTLNGAVILRTSNMFVGHHVEVSEFVTGEGPLVLEITFDSAIARGRKEMKQHPDHAWGVWNGDESHAAVRKAQYITAGTGVRS
jgi:beta-mannosidase